MSELRRALRVSGDAARPRSDLRSARSCLFDHRYAVLAVLVGVGLRFLVVLLVPQPVLKGDEQHFLAAALQVVAGEQVDQIPFRPPLYIYFCASLFRIFGPDPVGIRLTQAVMEGVSILGLYLLADRVLGRRTAALAAWLYALYPDFIAYSSWIWSETVTLGLLVWSLLALARFQECPGVERASVAGFLWGLVALVKPYHLYLTPLFFAWVVYCAPAVERPRALRASLVGLVIFAATWIPWSVHISLERGRSIVISDQGFHNLRDGTNTYRPPFFDYPFIEAFSPTQNAKIARTDNILVFILKNPGLFASRTVEKMSILVAPTSYIIRHIYRGKYGDPERIRSLLRIGTSYAVIFSTMGLLLVSILGYFASRRQAIFLFGVTGLYVGVYLIALSATPVLTRYRMPIVLFAVLFAAYFLAHPVENWRILVSRRTARIPAGVVILVLLALWSARVPALFAGIW